ncbi:5-oxoprolinase subunit PxpB [Pontibacter sp. MBLB2868]|uniref:5-oxoprolinase subunit PxpB n=1 Tax=Pontibacter sp. MBLB2868 TaxID=3451555 RepID=UPI003F74CD3C
MKQKELLPFQLCPLGDSAMVLQFDDHISTETHALIRSISNYFDTHSVTGITEYVPAYTTITFYYDPWLLSEQGNLDPYDKIVELLQHVLRKVKVKKASKTDVIQIPVCYGGQYGPDLEYVAKYHKMKPKEVVALHTKGTYLVHMIGFAPGFPYLGGLSKKLATPRKDHPRASIPKGSVGIAGNQTGIYPLDTPGGWQLIGRTAVSLFDPEREPPALLKTGDLIRFVPVTPEEYERQVKHEH